MKKGKIKILLYGLFTFVTFLGITVPVYALTDVTGYDKMIPGFPCANPLDLDTCYHYERRTDGPILTDKGIDTTKWRYLYTDQNFATYMYTLFWGEKPEDFEYESTTEKRVCSSGICNSAVINTECLLTCEYYEFIISEENPHGNTDAEAPSGSIIDESMSVACDDEGGKYVFDCSWYATTDEAKNLPHTSETEKVCCGEVTTEAGVLTDACTRLVAQSVVDQGYQTGCEQFKGENDDNRLEDITSDIETSCNKIFDKEARELMERIFRIICTIVPILVIVLGSVDFGQAVMSSDQEAMQKAVKRFTTRCIIAVAIFFLPLIVNTLFQMPGMKVVEESLFCDV